MFHGPLWFESICECMKFNNIIINRNKLNLKRVSLSTIKSGLWNFATYERAHWAPKRICFFQLDAHWNRVLLCIHSKSWYEIIFMAKGHNVNWLAKIKAHQMLLCDFIAASHLIIVVDSLCDFAVLRECARALARSQFELGLPNSSQISHKYRFICFGDFESVKYVLF